MSARIRIGTRESQLALWQANHVRDVLLETHPGLDVELVGITTQGDRILDKPLAAFGGKGLFLKELEVALEDGRIDLAVHSMKDVTVEQPAGLDIPVVMESADPRDAFVSGTYADFDALPHGAVIGTSSLRRRAQALYHRPDLEIRGLRGNVNTRLAKLDAGDYDAIILAVAGLERLQMQDRIRARLATDIALPAVGQGIVGIQCRYDDTRTRDLIMPLNDQAAAIRLTAERAVNRVLDGGCHMPLAAHAVLHTNDQLVLRANMAMPDGTEMIAVSSEGAQADARQIGEAVAAELLAGGARSIIDRVAGYTKAI